MAQATLKDDTNNCRSSLAQITAALGFSVLCSNLGLVFGMQTLVIGALRGDDNSSNLKLSESEASWFGGLLFIVQPIGCVGSAFLQDWLGRKKCLMLINIPQLVGWVFMYFATSVTHLFVAIIIFGLGAGFMEAPILSYIGEICQPRLRGVLTSFANTLFNVGLMLETFIGAYVPWRTMMLYSMLGPAIGFMAMLMVPESPSWLVTKGRVRDAEKAFQWLRGWVRPEAVQGELEALVTYVRETQVVKVVNEVNYKPVPDTEKAVTVNHTSKWRIMLEPDVLRALRIINIYFVIGTSVSMFGMRPYFIEILGTMNVPLKPHYIVAICGVLQMLGAGSLGVAVKILGKRGLTFLSLALSIFCCLSLGTYLVLDAKFPVLIIAIFCLSYYASTLGVITIPWILIMELFPLRARGLAGGICGGIGYILMFLVIKTYYNVITLVGTSGACFFYGAVGILGFFYLYFELPETEGIRLEDIEKRLSEERTAKERKKREKQ